MNNQVQEKQGSNEPMRDLAQSRIGKANVGAESMSRLHQKMKTLNAHIMASADASDACKAETEVLSPLVGFDSYENPFWFYHSSYYDYDYSGKNWTSYFDCEGLNCDFTGMTEALAGHCYLWDGVLYKVDSNTTCITGEKYYDTNLPFCVGPSCTIDQSFLEDSEDFNYCPTSETPSFETEVTKVPPPVSDECLAQQQAFTDEAGSGDPFYVYGDDQDQFCNYYDESDTCDFMPLIEQFKGPCEDQGGVLYRFSDVIYYSETPYYGEGPYEGTYLNMPLCVGTSCNAKSYFEDVLQSSMEFLYEGDFIRRNDPYYGDLTYSGNYTLLSYTPVIDGEKPFAKFLLKTAVVDGEAVQTTKKCQWLAKKSNNAKKRICSGKKYQIFSDSHGPASNVCAATCGPYCRKEKRNAKFLYGVDDDSTIRTKQCGWLKMQDPDVIADVCGATVAAESTIYSQAADTCPKTCRIC